MNIIKYFAVFLVCALSATSTQAAEPDWQPYAALLHDHVHAGERNNIRLNLVDYNAWANDKHWPALLAALRDFNTDKLTDRNEKLAFWINTYNILAIKMVIDHAPLASIRDVGSFFSPVWKKTAGIIAGKQRSLHEIEHEILRSMGEPRIHFAIVCASVSCPDLRMQAYRAATLDAQLNDQTRRFLNTPGKGMKISGNNIYISKIFDWFADDFTASGGVDAFVRKYRTEKPLTTDSLTYLDYDWSLNNSSTVKQ
ncbi:MAG: DUF547 domain-containing protein [Mariprofundaceae bacterium]|nr:DUF547 domain-containing protein [Mariprofundaceae bacterium]